MAVVVVSLLMWLLPIWITVALLVAAVVVIAVVAFRLIPAFDPLGRVRWRLARRRSHKVCALTFDDGPSLGTAAVLDTLRAHDVKATFFVLSANAQRHPHLVRGLADEGHTVAIHGHTHRKLHRATEDEVVAELDHADAALRRLGVAPSRHYRTPHGVKNGAVFRAARRRGLILWAWSRGIWDTDRPPAARLVARATRFARSGMILLMHDGRGDEARPDVSSMAAALPHIIARLKARGFDFITLDEDQ